MGYTGLRLIQEADLLMFFAYMAFVYISNFDLFPQVKNVELGRYELIIIYIFIGWASIVLNVIPKYLNFGGAQRHLNDNKKDKTERKFLARNYIRLFFHILSGAYVFIFGGWAVLGSPFSFGFLKYSLVFMDFMHQVTIILMTRNHDGIFFLRSNNFAFALFKCWCDREILYATSFEAAKPYITTIFLYTSGFASTRFLCAIIAIAQMLFGYEFDALRENWYSLGQELAHFLIGYRTGAISFYNALFCISAMWFKHELWTSKNDYQNRAIGFGAVCLAIFGAQQLSPSNALLWDDHFHNFVHFLLLVVNFTCIGPYFKREPLAAVDFRKDGQNEEFDAATMKEKENDLIQFAKEERTSYYGAWTSEVVRTPLIKSVRAVISTGSALKKVLSIPNNFAVPPRGAGTPFAKNLKDPLSDNALIKKCVADLECEESEIALTPEVDGLTFGDYVMSPYFDKKLPSLS